MKKNAQVFLVVVAVVFLFSSAQSATDHALLKVNKLPDARQHRLSQIFLSCVGADLDLIMNATSI